MPEVTSLEQFLDEASVDSSVWTLRPDYQAILLVADGLLAGPSDEISDALVRAAEIAGRDALGAQPVEQLEHVAAWRDAYRAFGAKPQRTRSSLEALLRRLPMGLPRVNRLTDMYNAISVIHQIPVGGEDLANYEGSLRLVRAGGDEFFETINAGVGVVECPEPGEVVWRDDVGVTCRRWNWRQTTRTQLRIDTTSALLIFDALAPITAHALNAAADELLEHLEKFGASVRSTRRLLTISERK